MYTNACMMGIADILANIALRVSQQYFTTQKGFIVSFFWVFGFTVVYLFVQNIVALVPIVIL